MYALGATVLADVALGRRVGQVDLEHLGIAAAGDEGGAEAEEHPTQVQHEPVRHVALAQQGTHLVGPHLAAARVGPIEVHGTITVMIHLDCTDCTVTIHVEHVISTTFEWKMDTIKCMLK